MKSLILLVASTLFAPPALPPVELDGPTDHDAATRVDIDRFAEGTGMLFVRTASNGLPGPNEAIDFDQGPFITQGLGPTGQKVRYYNFDVQATQAAPIYVLFREGEMEPVSGQFNIVDVVPGDEGYNDFWHVQKVTVPRDYEANSVTSLAEIESAGYDVSPTDMVINCPIVPEGSSAKLRGGEGEDAGLSRGWYKGDAVFYFTFLEKALTSTSGRVPISPIYVTFNVNPDMEGGGPGSGFMTEEGSAQTHNALQTLPPDAGYSPLWFVSVYDNKDFGTVHDAATAARANILARGVANVNCPVVWIG